MIFEKPTPTQQRCLTYMDAWAAAEGIPYHLGDTHANAQTIMLLWEQSMEPTETEEQQELLANLCRQAVIESRVGILNGVRHKEPATAEEMEEYRRLFNTAISRLDMNETRLRPPQRLDIPVSFEVQSDDQEILKLVPGKQLSLFEEIEEL